MSISEIKEFKISCSTIYKWINLIRRCNQFFYRRRMVRASSRKRLLFSKSSRVSQ